METPLQRICRSYIYEASPKADDSATEAATDILLQILNNSIDYDTAKTSIEALIGTSAPAEKVYCIAQVDITKQQDEGPELQEKPEHGRRRARPWTTEEDYRLLAAIYKHGLDNWGEVVKIVGNGRTRPQCSQRWYRGIDPKINKAQWTFEEDQKLFKLVDELGTKVWSKIAHHMGSRSDVQCRYRYFQINKSKSQTRKNNLIIQRRPAPSAAPSPPHHQPENVEQTHVNVVADLTVEGKNKITKKEGSQLNTGIDFADPFENLTFGTPFDLSSIDLEFPFI